MTTDGEEEAFADTPERALEVLSQVLVIESQSRVVIETTDEAESAARFLTERVQPGIQRIKDTFADAKSKAWDAHKAVVRAERELLAPLENAKALVTDALASYREQSERLAREREAQLIDRARKVQERIASAEGSDTIDVIPVTTVAPPSIPGVRFRYAWRAECDDIVALAQAVVDGRVQPLVLMPNLDVLHEMAREQKDKFAMPGCRSVRIRSVVAQRARR